MRAIGTLIGLVVMLLAAGCTQTDATGEAAASRSTEELSEQVAAESVPLEESDLATAVNTPVEAVEEATASSVPADVPEEATAVDAPAEATAEATAEVTAEATASSTPESVPEPVSEDDVGEIYAAAIRQVYAVEHSFGGDPPEFPLVYIANKTADGTLYYLPATPPQKLSPALRQSIAAELADQPFEIMWVESLDDVPADSSSGALAEGQGIYITLGNVLPQDDGTVQLPLSMLCGPLCASGKVYVLEEAGGSWHVTGNVGLVIEA